MTPLLSVKNLSVAYRNAQQWTRVTHDVSFDIHAGESVAIVGESGSGKTTTAQAILGLLSDNARIEQGEIWLNNNEISRWNRKRLQHLRGKFISLIPQDPSSSLDPVMKIGTQIAEVFKIHNALPKHKIKPTVIELLEQVGLRNPKKCAEQYPHELSGGMKQRVLIAMAIALKPKLIIADEPTSALDVTVQKRILDLIDDIRREYDVSLLMVTHDLGVASDRASRIIVMQNGRIQEVGESQSVLSQPQSEYTKNLVANAPSLTPAQPHSIVEKNTNIVVDVKNLNIDYVGKKTHRAVDNLSFQVRRGTTHAIVGESGSGKTSTIRAICGFITPSRGVIAIDDIDLVGLKGKALRLFRRRIQLVYQNPFGSLDPRYSIGKIIEEPLLNFGNTDKETRQKRVYELLDQVELPKNVYERYPRALSGGQRQRVAIARALILKPEVLVLDEAVSALDVTVQAQILNLLDRLQKEEELTYIFVSHDLSVVRQISDTITVLKDGKDIENGSVEQIFTHPSHIYTRNLISAIPGKTNALNKSLLAAQL